MAIQSTRILIVEDEAAHAEAIVRSLETTEAVELRLMGSLREFREQAESWNPDIALMDLNLPDGRATELLADPTEARAFPIVVMTSYGSEQAAVEALKLGAWDYLVKSPESFRALPKILERVLREWGLRTEGKRLHRELKASEAELRRQTDALRLSEAKTSAMMANIADVIAIIAPDGTNQFKSANIEKWFGWKPEELIGQDTWRNIHLDDRARIQGVFATLLQAPNALATDQCRYLCRDGSYKWMEFTAVNLVHDPDIAGVLLNYHDITERRRQAEALRSSQDLLAKAFSVSPEAIAITNLEDGVYVEINEGFTKITGYTEEEVLGRSSVADLKPLWADPNDRKRLVAGLKEQGEVLDLEATFLTKGGTPFFGLMSAKIFDLNGAQHVLSVTRDITDRKLAEEVIARRIAVLTQSEGSRSVAFEDLFDLKEIQRIQDEFAVATGVASLITRADGTPITEPSNFTHLCRDIIRKTEKGCSNCFRSDALLGRYHPDGPIVQPCLSGGLWDAGATISVGDYHVANWLIGQVRDETQTDANMIAYAREIGADETSFLEAFHAVPAMSRERFEQIASALFTLSSQLSNAAYQNIQQARFIEERERAQEAQTKLQAQLQQAQKMESLGTLAGGVAHDMNNVLGAILGLASANIEAQPAGSPTQRAFETIIKAADRGGKMVKGLLSFARQSPAESRELDINALLHEDVCLLERTTLANILLKTDFEADLRPIRGDASALTHAFMNLCVNAVDAMPEHGTLTLRTRNVDNDWIEVVVEDTGTGMPQEILEKAMDPFFTTKDVGKGTGLGLSTTYSTVKAHQGQMEIQSEPSKGTRVRMRFPAFESVLQADEPAAEHLAEGSPKALSVLVVDDDELIQTSMLAILEALGHSAAIASSGEEALARLEAGSQPDVVILDLNMPGLGGAGTLPRLRALNPTVPVLLATGRVDQFASDLAEAHSFVTLLSKPFSMGELQQHLERFGLLVQG